MDHSPFFDAEHAALLADIMTAMSMVTTTAPGTAPVAVPGVTAPIGGAPALPPPTRFVKFGGYLICPRCRYTEEFCGCQKAKPPPPPTQDGADSSLNARIRQLRSGR